LRLCEF